MLRLCNKSRRTVLLRPLFRSLSSSPPPHRHPENPIVSPNNLTNTHHIPQSPSILRQHNSLSPQHQPHSRKTLIALSATLISTILASIALVSTNDNVCADVERSIEGSKDAIKKVLNRMRQTGVAATVLLKSLRSVLSSANQEVRLGFELRVAAFLADIVAANESRRAAIVGAGGGAVVDWLLETVSSRSGDSWGTQAEAARALAYLIADENVCGNVLGRPCAVPNLLRFIFSFQPKRSNKDRRSSLDGSNTLRGRSMLVAAIMDIVTSNCDSVDKDSFQPFLPADADNRDIAAAIEVVEEGCMHLDGSQGDENDDDGGKGIRGIGMKILGGTTVVGLSRTDGLLKMGFSDMRPLESVKPIPENISFQKGYDSSQSQGNSTFISVVPGLWDDLQCEHVAVPFAAWALANWALASEGNRLHIQELDQDGHAIMAALTAPERTVKWHGSLVARLLLEDRNLPLIDSVTDWSSSLLSTAFQASKTEDIPLAQVALSAFLVSVDRSSDARKVVMEKGLHLMRDIAKQTLKHEHVQETLAKALKLLSTGDSHLSLEESQKWSGILLTWVCGKFSSDAIRDSAIKILSCILEDYGPYSVPISQGWLTILLTSILADNKTPTVKGSTQPKSNKVKTQIDQSNVIFAAQISNQLASAVVNLAGNQLGRDTGSIDTFPLKDLLALEPFVVPFKNMKKDSSLKFDAADSALATLKGIKAITGLCMEDSVCQNKLADFGVLCLLKRFLLRDDYEQLAAIEAYDASKVFEKQERVSNVSGEEPVLDATDSSSIRVPPTAHIRRHAARLLNILSLLPEVQKAIIADETWCKWLDDCANGRISGCNDLKIQSYARAILLNIFCPEREIGNKKSLCSRYEDMIFLINPDLPHWKCSDGTVSDIGTRTLSDAAAENPDNGTLSSSLNGSNECAESGDPSFDIVFVHGLRGGPFKTWRLGENKSSTTSKSGLVEKIDEEAGKEGTCWPKEWLAIDFPHARLFTVKYKTNLTQWSGASLPLQEVSSMLLKKLISAGIGNRPVVFITHSMGGLVVKQMLYQAKVENFSTLVNNTAGVVFYSCPHFGSKLADMPWRMGLVFRPTPTIGELRSGSPVLVVLNDFISQLHKKGSLDVLSFSETMVTPIVEGYGGYAFRMEIVPIESAYPGFGELVVLESTDHINSCKPVNRTDPSYKETLEFLQKLKAHCA